MTSSSRDGNDLVADEARVFVLHITELAVDKNGGDDQEDGAGKLADHKEVAQQSFVLAYLGQPFEYFDRLEGGQIGGGIETGKDAKEGGRKQDGSNDPAVLVKRRARDGGCSGY